jgi:hypothetical protein
MLKSYPFGTKEVLLPMVFQNSFVEKQMFWVIDYKIYVPQEE